MNDNFAPVTGQPVIVYSPSDNFRKEIVEYLVRQEFEVYGVADLMVVETYLATETKGIEIIDSTDISPEVIKKTVQFDVNGHHTFFLLSPSDRTEKWKQQFGPAANGPISVKWIDSELPADHLKDTIVTQLEKTNTRGQRRYVRFGGENKPNASFRFTMDGTEFSGTVHDISSVGMSCAFEKETVITIDDYIGELHLFLDEKQFTLAGKVFQQRWLDEEKRLFVVMFDKRMPESVRRTIQDFIHSSLQSEFNMKMQKRMG